jgi:hypothetical protein
MPKMSLGQTFMHRFNQVAFARCGNLDIEHAGKSKYVPTS